MGKLYIILLLSFYSSFSWSLNHQDEVAKAQAWVNSFNRPYPIIIIDRDKINFLIKSNQASDDEQKSFSLVQNFLEKETGVTITKKDYQALEPYFNVMTNSAAALPISQNFTTEYKFCAVLATPPNGNAQLESGRIAGFENKEAFHKHQDLNFNNLDLKMSFDELYLFSLYHESAHCLDEKYIVDALKGHGDAHGIHEAEAYAEIMAYFALTEELGTDVAPKRAAYRSVYSRVVGKHLTSQQIFGNPMVKNGGAIYNLGSYLLKAQELLYFNHLNLDARTVDTAAYNFVEEYVMSSREFKAIDSFLKHGAESTLAEYSRLAFNNPELFNSSYLMILEYQGQTNLILENAFSTKSNPDYKQMPKLNIYELCDALINKDQKTYLEILNDYRTSINNSIFELQEIKEVYNTLNNMAFSCSFS